MNYVENKANIRSHCILFGFKIIGEWLINCAPFYKEIYSWLKWMNACRLDGDKLDQRQFFFFGNIPIKKRWQVHKCDHC